MLNVMSESNKDVNINSDEATGVLGATSLDYFKYIIGLTEKKP